MDHEALRRENEALKRALEEAKQRELESAYQQLKASEERERQLLRIVEYLTVLPAEVSIDTDTPLSAYVITHPQNLTQRLGRRLDHVHRVMHMAPATQQQKELNDDVPLRQRILHYFETHPGPHTVSEARKAIGTTKSVKDALLYLHGRGEIERVARATYQVVRPATATRPQRKPNEPPPDSLLGRVLAYMRESGNKRLRPWQVANALGLKRVPGRELSKLAQRKLISRVGQSVYTGEPPDTVDISDAEKQKSTDDEILIE